MRTASLKQKTNMPVTYPHAEADSEVWGNRRSEAILIKVHQSRTRSIDEAQGSNPKHGLFVLIFISFPRSKFRVRNHLAALCSITTTLRLSKSTPSQQDAQKAQ